MENYFGKPSERIASMRQMLLDIEPQVCVERAVFTTEAYKEHRSEPNILKRAYAISNTLRKMSVYIEEGSLLAGNQASENRAAPIYPEYAMDWVIGINRFSGISIPSGKGSPCRIKRWL